MKSTHGHTLIEIIIVLSILAIFAYFAVPSFSNLQLESQETELRDRIIKIISEAKLQSLYRRATIALCQATNQQHCVKQGGQQMLVFLNPDGNGEFGNHEQLISTVRIAHRDGVLHWRAYPVYRDFLLFYNGEIPRNDNATIWDCHRSSPRWAITLSQTGQMQVVMPDTAGVIYDAHLHPLDC